MVLAVPLLLRPLKAIFENLQSTFSSTRNYFWTLHHLPRQTFKRNEPRHHRHRLDDAGVQPPKIFLLHTPPLAEQNTSPCFQTAWAEHVLAVLACHSPRTANCAWLYGKALRNLGSTTSHNQSQSTWRFVSFSHSIRNQTVWLFLGPPVHRWTICCILLRVCVCVLCRNSGDLTSISSVRILNDFYRLACAGDMIRLSPGESCIHFAVRHLQLEALEFLVNQPGANKALPPQPCHRTGLSHEPCTEVTIYIHILCVHLHWLALIRNDASSVGGFKKLPNWTAEIGCRSLWCAHTTGSTGEWFREKHL